MSLPRLRAPAENGAILVHPPLAAVGSFVERNRDQLLNPRLRLGPLPLLDLRRNAISEIGAAARDYLVESGQPANAFVADSLFVAGHQPDLFHPGVWLKNFALNAIARQHGAIPLNLVVDNDTAKASAIHMPVLGRRGDPSSVHLVTVPFDSFSGEVPYEERAVHDERLFAEFPAAVAERAADWRFEPIVSRFWNDMLRQRQQTPLLGERLAAARRTWERSWGCHNLELPISKLCQTESFARFAIAIIEDLPAFHASYNECVHEYRRNHRIRSLNHPVPDLLRDGDWLESPFWAWRAGGQRRSRLFVRSIPGGWRLRAGDKIWRDLSRETAINQWRRLETDGLKVRTRALTTTLFARLCLADLFVHGIGGGKYDELTDTIIARHFGIAPPTFLVLTGTLHLPIAAYSATTDDERAAWRLVRDIHWNPQRHLPADAEDWQDMVEARHAVTLQPDSTWRKQRFKELRRLTERIRARVADIEAEKRRLAERTSDEVAANAVLQRRDYAFCLFPESTLRPFLTRITS